MKMINKTLLTIALGLPLSMAAQTVGDLTHMSSTIGVTHDSTSCSTTIDVDHFAVINNSFVGDSIKAVDWSGTTLYALENTAGTNPWNVNLPFIDNWIESDELISGNTLNAVVPSMQIYKVISYGDTVVVDQHFVNEFIADPCAYGTVTGQVYIDNNSNCTYATGDSAIFALSVSPQATFASTPFLTPSPSNTNASGDYNLMIQESWMTEYTVSIPTMYQFIFPNSTCGPLSQTFTTLPQTGVDFVLECADIDTYVSGTTGGSVHAALPFNFHPSVANIGCDEVSGVLKMVLDPNVTYNSGNSSNPADWVDGDTLFWNYTNLNNIAGGAYWNSIVGGVELMPLPAVTTGDVLCFKMITAVPNNDIDAANNVKDVCVPVVAAYDPNVKYAMPQGTGAEGFIPVTTETLTYTIHFQNTGSADAINIYVIDSLEQNIIPSTFRVLSSSHTMSPQWLDTDVIRFNFNNIYLPDSNANEPDSHGFVEFEIDMVQGLNEGTEIKNRADIYFDNNPAVTTDYALNTIEFTNGLESNEEASSAVIYPNPTTGLCFVRTNELIEKMEVMNINGQVITTTTQDQIDISDLPTGIYFIKIYTEAGIKTSKVIKK